MSLRYGRKRRYYKGKKTAKKVAYRALKVAYRAKKQLKGEHYYLDVTGTKNVTPTATPVHLCPIPQGDTNSSREGDQVQARSLFLRYELKNSSAGAAARSRIIVFAYAQDRRLTPTISGDDYSILETSSTLSPINYKNKNMFKVLHDESYTGSPDSTTQWIRKIHIKLNHPIHFTNTDGTQFSRGHIFMLCISNDGTNYPICDYYTRLRYTEQ